MHNIIEACNLTKKFRLKKTGKGLKNLFKPQYKTVVAVNNISFAIKPGERVAFIGPNGAGKSTLMNMMTGYLAPTSGQIEILGSSISDAPLAAKNVIGFLPEGAPLYPDLSVRNFLNYMAELRGFSAADKKKRIEEIAALANIDTVMEQKIETLSKGYLRRVGFAQSILSDPPLLLLDEPTDGLDPNQKEHIRSLINRMGKNKTILISTHLLEEAQTICNRIIIINKGQIVADGCLNDILKQNKTDSLEKVFKKLTTTTEAI